MVKEKDRIEDVLTVGKERYRAEHRQQKVEIRKIEEPLTDPCGKPVDTVRKGDLKLSIVTL